MSGMGAKLYGGRWNPKGKAVLYTAENKSLAALEVLVHLDRNTIPDDLMLVALEINEKNVETLSTTVFENIQKAPNRNERMKKYGADWLDAEKSIGLKVPSVLIKGEFNILINPVLIGQNVAIKYIEAFKFDKRFFI